MMEFALGDPAGNEEPLKGQGGASEIDKFFYMAIILGVECEQRTVEGEQAEAEVEEAKAEAEIKQPAVEEEQAEVEQILREIEEENGEEQVAPAREEIEQVEAVEVEQKEVERVQEEGEEVLGAEQPAPVEREAEVEGNNDGEGRRSPESKASNVVPDGGHIIQSEVGSGADPATNPHN